MKMVFRAHSCMQNYVCIKQSQVRKSRIWTTNCLAPAGETVGNAFQTLQKCPTWKPYYTFECENINWLTLFWCKLKIIKIRKTTNPLLQNAYTSYYLGFILFTKKKFKIILHVWNISCIKKIPSFFIDTFCRRFVFLV